MIFSLATYKGVCEKINIAIGVIFTAHHAARCGIYFFVQKNVGRFPCLPLRFDPHEARIDGVANKKPLFNCVYILPIFPLLIDAPVFVKLGQSQVLHRDNFVHFKVTCKGPHKFDITKQFCDNAFR